MLVSCALVAAVCGTRATLAGGVAGGPGGCSSRPHETIFPDLTLTFTCCIRVSLDDLDVTVELMSHLFVQPNKGMHRLTNYLYSKIFYSNYKF